MSYVASDLEAHNREWSDQIKSRQDDMAAFLSYFDTASSVDEAYQQGFWDLSFHVLKPKVLQHLGEPYKLNALEIGFGGGRLVHAASKFFERVYGVDIHDSFEQVESLLKERGVNNVKLLKGAGSNLPVPNDSIDFVFSFIVLQHLPYIETLESYISEVSRILKVGKPTILYFGYKPLLSRNAFTDMNTSSISSSRENSLLIKSYYARQLLSQAGLKVIGGGRSPKRPWSSQFGQQTYVIAIKS